MIPEYKKVLYATDLSENAAKAFSHAVSIAKHYDGEIHIIHVIPPLDYSMVNYLSTMMGGEKLAELGLELKDDTAEEIKRRVHDFLRGELLESPDEERRIASIIVETGHAPANIIDTAEKIGADLIVLASHGKGPLGQVFLGSVSEKILRKAKCPVLLSRLID
ncbi:MAG: universal stress protein [Deltaproteobacteria bacterium]|nr:MAG: universal stress protein [Deltaproteobacteria bacterium]